MLTITDLLRRKRVEEISKEGCLRSAKDYLAAALIYQHGDKPKHYYQAYSWAKQANEIAGTIKNDLMALAIDRYLVRVGKKQLFGSQYYKQNIKDPCFCMQQVETSFPDNLRKKYLGKSLDDRTAEMFALLNNGKECPVLECSKKLEPTPKGTVPGLW